MTWVFLVLLCLTGCPDSPFGPPYAARFESQTQAGCERLRTVIVREMENMHLRYQIAPDEGCKRMYSEHP